MNDEERLNQKPAEDRPYSDGQPETKIERRINEELRRDGSFDVPLSWQPVRDQTDSNPPDGGSGVGESDK